MLQKVKIFHQKLLKMWYSKNVYLKTFIQPINFEKCLLWTMSQGYTLWALAVSVCPMHGKTVTEVTITDYTLGLPFLQKGLGKPLQDRPIPFWPLRTTIHSNMLCIGQEQPTVISWDCLKPMWLPWAPHISGTEHNPFSLPSLELYSCLLTFVGSQKSSP